jgi:hypothetical protein
MYIKYPNAELYVQRPIILAAHILYRLLKEPFIIAGGSIVDSYLGNMNTPKDIDIWLYSLSRYRTKEDLVEYLKAKTPLKVRESEFAINIKSQKIGNLFGSFGRVNIQFIKTTVNSPEDLLNAFDISYAKAAVLVNKDYDINFMVSKELCAYNLVDEITEIGIKLLDPNGLWPNRIPKYAKKLGVPLEDLCSKDMFVELMAYYGASCAEQLVDLIDSRESYEENDDLVDIIYGRNPYEENNDLVFSNDYSFEWNER